MHAQTTTRRWRLLMRVHPMVPLAAWRSTPGLRGGHTSTPSRSSSIIARCCSHAGEGVAPLGCGPPWPRRRKASRSRGASSRHLVDRREPPPLCCRSRDSRVVPVRPLSSPFLYCTYIMHACIPKVRVMYLILTDRLYFGWDLFPGGMSAYSFLCLLLIRRCSPQPQPSPSSPAAAAATLP